MTTAVMPTRTANRRPGSAPIPATAIREQVLLDHLPQVRYVAQRIHERIARHVPLEDLISAGCIGLMDAFDKFDSGKKVQLQTYAQFRIHGAIMDSLRELDWSPRDLRRKARELEQARRRVETHVRRTATQEEIAAEMGVSIDNFHNLTNQLRSLELGQMQVVVSSEDDSEEDVLSYTPSPESEDPLFLCLRGEMKELLARAIDQLSEKERTVITLYYFEELNMKEVGEALEIGESRVSQLHSSAMRKLRSLLPGMLSARPKAARNSHPSRWPIQAT